MSIQGESGLYRRYGQYPGIQDAAVDEGHRGESKAVTAGLAIRSASDYHQISANLMPFTPHCSSLMISGSSCKWLI